MFQFCASTLIRYSSVNIPINLQQPIYQIPLIKPDDIEWGLEHNYKYVHLGLLQFGINPLVDQALMSLL
jgi:hypothetical protein